MKHRDLSVAEVKEFIKYYPKYTDEEVIKEFEIGESQLQDIVKTFKLKKENTLSLDYGLNADQVGYLKENYSSAPNKFLANKLDIMPWYVAKLAKKYNLKKSKNDDVSLQYFTKEEKERGIVKYYSRYTDAEVLEKFEISRSELDEIVKSYALMKKKILSADYGLDAKQMAYFKENYKDTANLTLSSRLSISQASVASLAKKYNLVKVRKTKGKVVRKSKKCSRCKDNKPIGEFRKEARALDGHTSACKKCLNNTYYSPRIKPMVAPKRRKVNPPKWWVLANQELIKAS